MPASRPATILHTSDCHLEYVDDGLHQRAFAAMIDLSIELDVDLVLIAGDMFDHSRIREPMLEWTAEQLDRTNRPVVLIVGNHDCLNEYSVHHRFDANARCQQVHFLADHQGSTVEVPGTDIVVWGKAMPEHEPKFRPLLGSPARQDTRWHVVAGHGLVIESQGDLRRSSPIYPADLDAVDADYVALGHIHAHGIVRERPLTVYSGSTANSRKGEPGCVVVDLVPGESPTLRWESLADAAGWVPPAATISAG
jgi:DNA repair exonuclease SbcCD nuclease subunit